LRIAFGAFWLGLAVVGVACSKDVSVFRQALDANGFSDYRVVTPDDDTRRRQEHSLGRFESGVLVGDFNFDGSDDFAVLLSRSATRAEIASSYLPPGEDASNQQTFVAVVCNAFADATTTAEYRCTRLSEDMVGAFRGELMILAPNAWSEDLSTISDAAGKPQCPRDMPSFSNRPLLGLDEPDGRCSTFYYPNSDGTYGKCIYCAD